MPNTPIEILYPIFALVLLTAIVWFKMYYVRFSEMKKAGLKAEDMTPDNRDLSKIVLESGANFRNLCEAPILFYLACVLIFILDLSSSFLLSLAWLYVFFRYVHSFIHTTSNKISHRFIAYFLSTIILWLIWIALACTINL